MYRLLALDTAIGRIDGIGVVVIAGETEDLSTIGIVLGNETGAIILRRAPAPTCHETLTAKIKQCATGLREVIGLVFDQMVGVVIDHFRTMIFYVETEQMGIAGIAGIAIVEDGDVIACRILMPSDVMLT